MGWYENVKSYVWDDRTTPYLVPVSRMSRPQADKELSVYTLFLTLVFSVGAIAALALARAHENPLYHLAAVYAVTVVWCAIYVGFTRDGLAARYCVTAPVAAFLGFVSGVLNPHLHWLETVFLGAFTLLWLRYSLRVVALVDAYADLPPHLPADLPEAPPSPRRRDPRPPGPPTP